MAKVAITAFAAVLVLALGVAASDSDVSTAVSVDVDVAGPDLNAPCALEDKLDFVMCLKMASWARGWKGSFNGVDDVNAMCQTVQTNPETRARCATIMGVTKTQPNCAVNAKLSVFYGYLKTRIDEEWCWAQLKHLRTAASKPVPAESCRAETISGKPRCLFFHGVGEKGPDHGVNQRGRQFRSRHPGFLLRGLGSGDSDMKTYWGKTESHIADQCEPWYFHTETAVSGWDRGYLQDEYCGAIELLNPAVIFTHSMANLVVSAGMINKVAGCHEHIGKSGLVTRWFGIQGPLQGATPTGIGVLKCKTLVKLKFLKKLIDGRCDEETGGLPPSYASMVLGYVSKEPGKAQLKCKKDVNGKKWTPNTCVPLAYMATLWMSGSLCGLKPTTTVDMKTQGIFKKKIVGWALTLLSKLTHKLKPDDPDWDNSNLNYPETGNDGMVGFASCRLYQATGTRMRYSATPDSLYYGATVNHADGTCREGDVPSDPKQQACAWVKNSVWWALEQRAKFTAVPEEQNPSGLTAHVARQNARIKASRAARDPAAAAAAATPSTPPATPSRTPIPEQADALATAIVDSLEARQVAQESAQQKVDAAVQAQAAIDAAAARKF